MQVERGLEHVGEPTSRSSLKAPAPPLIECTARNTALTVSASAVALLHREQAGLQFAELFLAFLEEGLPDRLHRIHDEPSDFDVKRPRGG